MACAQTALGCSHHFSTNRSSSLQYARLYRFTLYNVHQCIINEFINTDYYIHTELHLFKRTVNKIPVDRHAAVISRGALYYIRGSLQSLLSFSFNKGDLIVIIAVVCWSVYSLLIKKYAGKLPGYSTFLVTIAIGAIMLLPFALYEQLTTSQAIVWNASTIGAIIYVGIIASIIAF